MIRWLTRLHKTLLYLLILFLPIQLGKHFWPDWTMVNGLRVDYLSPTLYFTDLLILGILISWLVEIFIVRIRRSRVRTNVWNFSLRSKNKRLVFLFLGFSVFLSVNYFFAQNQPAAFYKLIKIVEFGFLGFYVAKNSFQISNFTRQFGGQISIAVIYSSLLAVVQFLRQGSIGGIFYWLGERSFNSDTPGIAQAIWNGQLLLRPYATFPHPNVLAGFLVISLVLIIWQRSRFWWLSGGLGTVALFLTFSKTAIFVYLLSLIFYFLFKKKWWFIINIIVITIITIIILPFQPESVSLRWDLNKVALQMWQSSPLVGIGLNNFLVRLPEFYRQQGFVYFLQPAHNFYLMVLAETGIIGLIGLIWLIGLTLRRLALNTKYQIRTTLIVILIISFFDHYFYTLQQTQILLAVICGLSWQKKQS